MKFSDELESWLKKPGQKTILQLNKVFGRRSFAVAFLLLMFIPALPLPTGGITHFFEVIVVFLASQMMIGGKTIWLPRRWRKLKLGKISQRKLIPFVIRRIRWFERWSRPRLEELLDNPGFLKMTGALVAGLALVAFLAPPFSGLDTLPALGVVLISLALLLEDIVFFMGGVTCGLAGVGLILAIGTLVGRLFV